MNMAIFYSIIGTAWFMMFIFDLATHNWSAMLPEFAAATLAFDLAIKCAKYNEVCNSINKQD